jgi:nucleotide-binding universal stress UspA family protein
VFRGRPEREEKAVTETAQGPATGKRVLVGIDDSEGAALALDYALDEAVRRAGSLRAVMAFEPPYIWITSEGVVPPTSDLQHEAKQEATRIVEKAVQARRDRGLAVPATEVEVYSGPPSAVLQRLSKDADVLVVGHRGRGGVASHLIGSVGLNSVIHAACTVIVVRG